MGEYIKKSEAIEVLEFYENIGAYHDYRLKDSMQSIKPDDVVEVVRCKDCTLHGNCITEDHFKVAGIENPYCCVGKRKEP